MKGSLQTLLTVVIISFVSPGVAQNEYFQNNPIWKSYSSCAWNFPCITNENYNYFLTGDTTINATLYKKVCKKGTGTYFWGDPNPPPPSCNGSIIYSFINTVPSFYLRSAGTQMFIYPTGGPEYLLYDFNLAIGDSLPLTWNNVDSTVTVTAIDSFFTPSGYRKRFTLAGNTWAQYLLEGVGSSRGLIEPLQVPFECGYQLDCYGQNNSAYYPAPGPSCDLMVGEEQVSGIRGQVSVFPNPFADELNVSSYKLQVDVTLYNAIGEIVIRATTNDSNLKLSTFNLKSGIYLLRVRSMDEIIMKKVIKH